MFDISSILLYIPNIICYIRIILLISSIYLDGYLFALFYIVSSGLDILDGYTARYYNQCTIFGSVLDMLIDRLLNIIILTKITKKIKEKKFSFISLLFCIDFLSNMLSFCGSLSLRESHKIVNNQLLAIYYNKNMLLTLCSTTEIGFVLMYLLPNMYYLWILPYLVKSFFHIIQLHYGVTLFLNLHEKLKIN